MMVICELDGVPEALGIGIGEEEGPGAAGVGGFVEAGEVSFARGHDDGGGGVEGLDAAEVELLGSGRYGAGLPGLAVVDGAQDGPVGSRGPGDAVADRVDAAQVGRGGGGEDLPLGLGWGREGGGDQRSGEEGEAHGRSVNPHLRGEMWGTRRMGGV